MTESKLDSIRDTDNLYQIDSYNAIRNDRENRDGGGTIIYINSNFQYEEIDYKFQPPSTCELCIVKIKKSGMKPIVFLTIYKPPNVKPDIFLTFFTQLCSFLNEQQLETVVVGDLNINLLINESGNIPPENMDFFLICKEYNISQLLNAPTHNKGALLDHVYVNNTSLYNNFGSFPYAGSDHDLCYAIRKQEKIKFDPKVIKVRNWNKVEWDKVKKELCLFQHNIANELCKASNFNTKSIDRDFQKMNEFALTILDKYAPERKMLVRGKFSPWLTSEVRMSMKKRNMLHKIAKKTNLVEDWKNFRKSRNTTNNLVTNSKKKYFKHRFEEDCKSEDMWESINKLTKYRCKKTTPITYLEVGKKRVYEQSDINDILADTFVVRGDVIMEDNKQLLNEIEIYEQNYDYSDSLQIDKEPIKIEHNDV